MAGLSPVGSNNAPNGVRSSDAASNRRSLLEAARSISETANGERNAQATGRFAQLAKAHHDGLGGAVDVRG